MKKLVTLWSLLFFSFIILSAQLPSPNWGPYQTNPKKSYLGGEVLGSHGGIYQLWLKDKGFILEGTKTIRLDKFNAANKLIFTKEIVLPNTKYKLGVEAFEQVGDHLMLVLKAQKKNDMFFKEYLAVRFDENGNSSKEFTKLFPGMDHSSIYILDIKSPTDHSDIFVYYTSYKYGETTSTSYFTRIDESLGMKDSKKMSNESHDYGTHAGFLAMDISSQGNLGYAGKTSNGEYVTIMNFKTGKSKIYKLDFIKGIFDRMDPSLGYLLADDEGIFYYVSIPYFEAKKKLCKEIWVVKIDPVSETVSKLKFPLSKKTMLGLGSTKHVEKYGGIQIKAWIGDATFTEDRIMFMANSAGGHRDDMGTYWEEYDNYLLIECDKNLSKGQSYHFPFTQKLKNSGIIFGDVFLFGGKENFYLAYNDTQKRQNNRIQGKPLTGKLNTIEILNGVPCLSILPPSGTFSHHILVKNPSENLKLRISRCENFGHGKTMLYQERHLKNTYRLGFFSGN